MNAIFEEIFRIHNILSVDGITRELFGEYTSTTCNLWKKYVKLQSPLNIGLVYAGTKEDDPSGVERTFEDLVCRLKVEHDNYIELSRAGALVPDMYGVWFESPVIKLGRREEAGILVQHLSELAVYKIPMNIEKLKRRINNFSLCIQKRCINDYRSIQKTCLISSPTDLQLMLTKDGRLYIIDVEYLGSGRRIPDL